MIDRLEKLMEELCQMPIVELFGMVGASGAGGGKLSGEDWSLSFAFDGWKFPGGAIQNRKLTIRKPVSNEELKTLMKQIRPFDVLHIQARVAEENSFGAPQGLLVNIIGKEVTDTDLRQRVAELQKPVVFTDKRFGVFTLDRRVNWFEAMMRWESTNIKLHLQLGEGGGPNECLVVAHALWDEQSAWSKRVADRAIAELLDLKNNNWLQEGESPLSVEQFQTAMQLESISVSPGGDFDFWFDDGDLFWGHAIRVSGSLSEGPTFAGIEG